MNKVILMGRLTRDPEVRYSQRGDSQDQICVARYTLAVDRRGKEAGTDFPSIVAFGKAGEFAEKYLRKGTKIILTGRVQTGSYTNRDGIRVYTTDIVAEDQEFVERKAAAGGTQQGNEKEAEKNYPTDENGFINIPEDIDMELPFN